MTLEHSNNPAQRLYDFLDLFRTHQNNTHTASIVLSGFHGVPRSERTFIQRELWRASQLPEKSMRALVHAVGEEPAAVICRWEHGLTEFFNILCLSAQVQHLVPYLDENTMHSVYTCAAFLAREKSDSDVVNLLERIEELRTEAEGMDLPDEVRFFVHNRLRDLEAAVGDYCHGVADSSEVVTVWWRTNSKIEDLPSKRSQKVKNAVELLGKLVVVANATGELVEKSKPALAALMANVTASLPPAGG